MVGQTLAQLADNGADAIAGCAEIADLSEGGSFRRRIGRVRSIPIEQRNENSTN
jgi:hypothetical protein